MHKVIQWSADNAGKQATKSKKTQDKILKAVISLIHEGGFAAASSTKIARAAGISWGVVQHHFGDKKGILTAVLDQCTCDYIEHMSKTVDTRVSPKKRIRQYIKQCWQFYQSEQYLVILEILLATHATHTELTSPKVLRERAETLLIQWQGFFPDSTADSNTISGVIRHVHIILTGLVIDHVLEGEVLDIGWHLDCLSTTIESQIY